MIELASNDGYLLTAFRRARNPGSSESSRRANVAEAAIKKEDPTRIEFFGETMARRLVQEGIGADLIVGNNVLAHVPALNDFVKG